MKKLVNYGHTGTPHPKWNKKHPYKSSVMKGMEKQGRGIQKGLARIRKNRGIGTVNSLYWDRSM